MKKTMSLLIVGAALMASHSADAAAKKLQSAAPSPKSAEQLKTPNCSAEYCVKVVLSSKVGSVGSLKVWKKGADKKYAETTIGCNAIGGNPTVWQDTAIYTPSGVKSVYKKTPKLLNGGQEQENYRWASYFENLPGQDDAAIHTAPSYSKNSHGCIRASCAKQVYDLQGDIEVDVVYRD